LPAVHSTQNTGSVILQTRFPAIISWDSS